MAEELEARCNNYKRRFGGEVDMRSLLKKWLADLRKKIADMEEDVGATKEVLEVPPPPSALVHGYVNTSGLCVASNSEFRVRNIQAVACSTALWLVSYLFFAPPCLSAATWSAF